MNKYIRLYLGAMAVLFAVSGCMSVDYIGKEYPETKFVRLFYDKTFVPLDKYEVIGHGEIIAPEGYASMDIDNKLISKGKAVGADAVLVLSSKTIVKEKTVNLEGDNKNQFKETQGSTHLMDSEDNKGLSQTYDAYDPSTRYQYYSTETIVKAAFLKRRANPAPPKVGVNVGVAELIESEAQGTPKVEALVKQSDSNLTPAQKEIKPVNFTSSSDTSQDELNRRNKLDQLQNDLNKMNTTPKNDTQNSSGGTAK